MIRQLTVGVTVLVLVAVGGALGLFLYARLAVGLTLKDQAALLHLPDQLVASAQATQPVAIRLHGRIDAAVPLKQTLTIPLKGDYPADILLDAEVPLRMTIHYQGMVPVHAATTIQGNTGLVFHTRLLPRFPLTVKVPLDFQLPLTLDVPVDTRLHLIYHGPISIAFNQDVRAPVDTVLHTYLTVDKDVNAPILKPFDLALNPRQDPIAATVKQADLRFPLKDLRLLRAGP